MTDKEALIAELRERELWGVVYGIAQEHGILLNYMLTMAEAVKDARNEAWHALDARCASRADIARWWNTSTLHVRSGISAHRKAIREARARKPVDESRPGLIHGKGEKHEDCARYASCVAEYARKSGTHARCPSVCSGYQLIELRATNYTRSNVDTRCFYNG